MGTMATTVTFARLRDDIERNAAVLGVRELLFVLLHIPLALVLFAVPELSTTTAWITVAIAVILALKSPRPEWLLYICGYLVGAELFWKMTHARSLMQVGKYSIAAICMIGLFRFRSAKSSQQPILYFCLLLPSIAVTFANTRSLSQIKEYLSYNLSGPFAFTICALFFSRLWVLEKDIRRMFLCTIAPIAGICTLTIYATLTAAEIRFITESNWVTSAEFNPCNVSGMLGLGGLLSFLLFVLNPRSRVISNLLLLGASIIFTVESAMTFSRQGVYMEIGGALVACYYLFRQKSLKPGFIILLVMLAAFFSSIVLPQLDTFTNGKFTKRFSDTDPTKRDALVVDDLKSFKENPLLGIGPGRSEFFRTIGFYKPHTEYSRLLAEHGFLGLLALGLLLLMLYRNWRSMGSSNLLLAPLLMWGMLFLSVNATRFAAPVFLLALTFVTVLSPELVYDQKPTVGTPNPKLLRSDMTTTKWRSLRP